MTVFKMFSSEILKMFADGRFIRLSLTYTLVHGRLTSAKRPKTSRTAYRPTLLR